MVRFQGYQDDPDAQTLDFSYLRRLWPFVRPYKWMFAVCRYICRRLPDLFAVSAPPSARSTRAVKKDEPFSGFVPASASARSLHPSLSASRSDP